MNAISVAVHDKLVDVWTRNVQKSIYRTLKSAEGQHGRKLYQVRSLSPLFKAPMVFKLSAMELNAYERVYKDICGYF